MTAVTTVTYDVAGRYSHGTEVTAVDTAYTATDAVVYVRVGVDGAVVAIAKPAPPLEPSPARWAVWELDNATGALTVLNRVYRKVVVKDLETKNPMPGVTLTIGAAEEVVTTDSSGVFLTYQASGEYDVKPAWSATRTAR